MKKLTKQQKKERLRKRCVVLAKKISKIRDNYKCRYCGIGKPQRQVHSHHIFHEYMSKAMSADIDNLITLCAIHHQGGFGWRSPTGFNFHNSPAESTEWLRKNWENYDELLERSNNLRLIDIIYWEKKLKELKEIKRQVDKTLSK